MAEKETPKLTEKQLDELIPLAKRVARLKVQSLDIAERIGELNFNLWGKVHEMIPEMTNKLVSIDWDTGEVTVAKDC